jgi:adenylate kinase
VSENLGLPHISSGDIFREHLKNETDLGVTAKSYMNQGELVPDDVTIAMIHDRVSRPDCSRGALLDGFPRTPTQAEALDDILAGMGTGLKAVPYIKVPDEKLIERLTGRWTCPVCGRVYHIKFNPPQVSGICDDDGTELYQREDDQVETVTRRIRVYHNQTKPLIDYYLQRDLLVEVDGDQPIDAVTDSLMTVLQKE